MENPCVFVDHLKRVGTHKIDEVFPPAFLDINEPDCRADRDVKLHGEAYLADEEVVVHLDMTTAVTMRCNICNEEVEVPIRLEGVYLTAPAAKLRNAVFELSQPLREEVALAIPQFVECHDGQCPKRAEFDKYFKKGDGKEDPGTHQPFAEL